MKRIKTKWACLFCAVLFFALSALPTSAEGVGETMPEGFEALGDVLPDEVGERLPDEFFSSDPTEVGQSVTELMEPRALLRFVGELAGVEVGSSLRLLARLCGLLILQALFETVRKSLGSEALAGAVRFCTTAAIFAAILQTQIEHLREIGTYFERLVALMGGMIPIAGTLWAMGGNVTTAAAGTSTLSLVLAVCQTLCAKTVLPVCTFCMAVALCQSMVPDAGLRGIASSVKKIYTFCLGLVMSLLLMGLSAQSALTAAADSVTARTAKLLSSTVIPVVGGSVGETLRTVATGVGYLKSVVGFGGIFLLLAIILPVFLRLVAVRLVFLLSAGIAEILGCENEGKLLGELGTVYGCMLAAVAMSGVMMILALAIFVKTSVAVG